VIASAVDRGIGGPPIRGAGGTGVRGDYSRFFTDDFVVSEAGAGGAPPPGAGEAAAGTGKAPQRFLSPALADGVNDVAEFGPEASTVAVLDSSGREVRRLLRGGSGALRWDCRDASGRPVESGVYIALIELDGGRRAAQSFAVVR
ncbi:MAG: hypothetical protein HY554_18225, partial [Elusimicrobia bacterium]|nr:hypothetical protein [Elusimicrobiota bacterium]